MILSIQGCMAVGKTTAVKYLQQNAPYVNISYETNDDVIDEIKNCRLNKNNYEDYLEIQKLFLKKEVDRYNMAIKHSCSVMDFGAEEIEFYTLNYPKTIGVEWEIENALHAELTAVRKCMPARILFLDASEEVLRQHKENDGTRSRNFFEHYLKYLLPLKREWFFNKPNVDILRVDNLSIEEVGLKGKEWCDRCITIYS
ncbi:MAG: deoxynucleoside kinase [Christensenellaceae bacterium]|nr:deoxynucleoside kinase [Christensenellaceae bacterium]